jgi:hypothetical protein
MSQRMVRPMMNTCSLYGELENLFDRFIKYHKKILLGDCNANLGRKDIFKPTVMNARFHEISNNNRVVNFSTSKKSVITTVFPH